MASKKDLAALTIVKISPELIEFDIKKFAINQMIFSLN